MARHDLRGSVIAASPVGRARSLLVPWSAGGARHHRRWCTVSPLGTEPAQARKGLRRTRVAQAFRYQAQSSEHASDWERMSLRGREHTASSREFSCEALQLPMKRGSGALARNSHEVRGDASRVGERFWHDRPPTSRRRCRSGDSRSMLEATERAARRALVATAYL